jgi:hypothetical protein
MLERQGLVVGPYAPGQAGRRPVRDAATGEELGYVVRLPGRPRWLAWLLPAALAVHEAEDEPLLCTVRGAGLGRGWHVLDADGRLVGEVRRGTLYFFDARAEVAAVLQPGPGRGAGRFHGGSGAALASFATDARGVVLTFLPPSEGDPLLRMTLLAATLMATG